MSALARRAFARAPITTAPFVQRIAPRAAFSTSKPVRGGDQPHYDAPTGWLFGVRPGEKPEKEGWEPFWYYGYFGCFAFAVIAYAFKPDTSIQTWALEEARRRLEAEGILPDPDNVKK